MAEDRTSIEVQVLFAQPDEQRIFDVEVPRGCTIRAAIERSRIQDAYPEINLGMHRVGVYGRLRELGDTVQAGDRIEIYRPLLVDPKEARRKNALAGAKS